MSRTSLTKYARTFREIDPDGARKASVAAWHKLGAVMVPVEILKDLPWEDRAFLESLAAKLYGKREAK